MEEEKRLNFASTQNPFDGAQEKGRMGGRRKGGLRDVAGFRSIGGEPRSARGDGRSGGGKRRKSVFIPRKGGGIFSDLAMPHFDSKGSGKEELGRGAAIGGSKAFR